MTTELLEQPCGCVIERRWFAGRTIWQDWWLTVCRRCRVVVR